MLENSTKIIMKIPLIIKNVSIRTVFTGYFDEYGKDVWARINSQELILPGSLKNYEIKLYIKTHKNKNIYYND